MKCFVLASAIFNTPVIPSQSMTSLSQIFVGEFSLQRSLQNTANNTKEVLYSCTVRRAIFMLSVSFEDLDQ